MTTFGDNDPEDSWDANDSLQEKLDILVRWAVSVLIEHAYEGDTSRVLHRAGEARGEATTLQKLKGLTPLQVATIALILEALKVVQ